MAPKTLKARLEQFITNAWYKGAWWLYALWPFALISRWVIYQRRQVFLDHPPTVSTTPVVIVGGITVGGTGKTPVIIALVQALTRRGLRVGVVSRGYGGLDSEAPISVTGDSNPALVGDEPVLIASKAHCPVVVCQRRSAAVAALDDGSLDLILSDDGLQHYAMARAFEIVVLDAERGIGNGHLLPMGPLREPAARLVSVDWILYRAGGDPTSAVHYHLQSFRHLLTGERFSTAAARAQWTGAVPLKLAAFAAIGQPTQFFETLEAQGFVGETLALADHQTLTKRGLGQIEADVIMTTEKDAVKLTDTMDPRIWVVEIAAELPQALIDKLTTQFAQEVA